MAGKTTSKKFNTGALQSIIDNVAIIYDYEFVGEVNTNYVDVNPISHPESYNSDGENVATEGAAQQSPPPAGSKNTTSTTSNTNKTNTSGTAQPSSTKTNNTNTESKPGAQRSENKEEEHDPLAEFESAWGNKFPEILHKYGRP